MPVFKYCLHIADLRQFVPIEFISDEKEFQLGWDVYQQTDGISHFSLFDRQRFTKTRLVEQGKPVYKVIKKFQLTVAGRKST